MVDKEIGPEVKVSEVVALPRRRYEQITIRLDGEVFRCGCGCATFHYPDEGHAKFVACNVCRRVYEVKK